MSLLSHPTIRFWLLVYSRLQIVKTTAYGLANHANAAHCDWLSSFNTGRAAQLHWKIQARAGKVKTGMTCLYSHMQDENHLLYLAGGQIHPIQEVLHLQKHI